MLMAVFFKCTGHQLTEICPSVFDIQINALLDKWHKWISQDIKRLFKLLLSLLWSGINTGQQPLLFIYLFIFICKYLMLIIEQYLIHQCILGTHDYHNVLMLLLN